MASTEPVDSSSAHMGSERDLRPPTSVTHQEGNLRQPGKVEDESLLIEGPIAPSLGRRRGEILPTAVPNALHRRPPRAKRRRWCRSMFAKSLCVTLLLGAAVFTAKVYLTLGSPRYPPTGRDVKQHGGPDVNETGHNDTDFISTLDSPNQTRLEETNVSVVGRTEATIGSRLNFTFSSAQAGRPSNTGHSAPTNDSAFVIKDKTASELVSPVLALLAGNLNRKDYHPTRPYWLEPEYQRAPGLANRTPDTISA